MKLNFKIPILVEFSLLIALNVLSYNMSDGFYFGTLFERRKLKRNETNVISEQEHSFIDMQNYFMTYPITLILIVSLVKIILII